jgi:hypothetical protein
MKTLINLTVATTLTICSTTAFSDEKDQTCNSSEAYDLAYQAMQEYEQKFINIPGVLKIEIESCNDLESKGVSKGKVQCGIYLWFADEATKESFYQTTNVWSGKVKVSNGKSVPVCSSLAPQVTNKGGIF